MGASGGGRRRGWRPRKTREDGRGLALGSADLDRVPAVAARSVRGERARGDDGERATHSVSDHAHRSFKYVVRMPVSWKPWEESERVSKSGGGTSAGGMAATTHAKEEDEVLVDGHAVARASRGPRLDVPALPRIGVEREGPEVVVVVERVLVWRSCTEQMNSVSHAWEREVKSGEGRSAPHSTRRRGSRASLRQRSSLPPRAPLEDSAASAT